MFRKCRRLFDLVAILGALAILPELWKTISPVAAYLSAVLVKTYLISFSIPLSVKAFFRYGGCRENPVRDVIIIGFYCVYTLSLLLVLLIPTLIHEGQKFWQPYPWRQVARTMKREMQSDWLVKAVIRWQRKR
jgi:hypothetical protein